MNQPKPIPERKALVDLMNEVIALHQRVPNSTRRTDEAFEAIYWHIDRQLETMPREISETATEAKTA